MQAPTGFAHGCVTYSGSEGVMRMVRGLCCVQLCWGCDACCAGVLTVDSEGGPVLNAAEVGMHRGGR
jgi:hypothetical protein